MAQTIHTSITKRTRDHERIRHWIENRGGMPAVIEDTWDGHNGQLWVDFGESSENLALISWDEFFRIFEENSLDFLYEKEGDVQFFEFVGRA